MKRFENSKKEMVLPLSTASSWWKLSKGVGLMPLAL